METVNSGKTVLGYVLTAGILFLGISTGIHATLAVNLNSQVVVANASPVVSNIHINGDTAITLIANATASIPVTFTVTDSNGCGDVFFSGAVTSTLFRSGVGASCSVSDTNCYRLVSVAHSCPNATSTNTSANATATFAVYYFANPTDASSSFSGEVWRSQIDVRDSQLATSTATSSPDVELNTLTALNITTSSLNYGSIAAGSDTGATNQMATSTNAGNSTTTLQLSAQQTLMSGGSAIATSSQRYATSTFTFPGTAVQLSGTPVTVTGFQLVAPTSTNPVSQVVYWGLQIPGGTATGTYTGLNAFSPLYVP